MINSRKEVKGHFSFYPLPSKPSTLWRLTVDRYDAWIVSTHFSHWTINTALAKKRNPREEQFTDSKVHTARQESVKVTTKYIVQAFHCAIEPTVISVK